MRGSEGIFSLYSDNTEMGSTAFGPAERANDVIRRIANLPSQSELQIRQHDDTCEACCRDSKLCTRRSQVLQRQGPGVKPVDPSSFLEIAEDPRGYVVLMVLSLAEVDVL